MNGLQTIAMEKFVSALAFVFGCALAMIVLHVAEQEFGAVTVDWVVTGKRVEGNDLIIEGVMRKRRECAFIAPPRARTVDGVQLQVKSYASGLSWAAGEAPQNFGPWRIFGGARESVELYLIHQCHPLWPTVSHLGEIRP